MSDDEDNDAFAEDDGDDAGAIGAGSSSGKLKDRFSKFATAAKKASAKAGAKIAEKGTQFGSIVAEKSNKLGSAVAGKSSDMMDKAKSMKKPSMPTNFSVVLRRSESKGVSSGNSSPSTSMQSNPSNDTLIFGAPLQDGVNASRLSKQIDLPAIVEQCITFLDERGLKEEGIYRIPGSTSKVNHVKYLYNTGQYVNLVDDLVDPHGVAGLLKLYLRELPEPIFTRDLNNDFQVASTIADERDRSARLKQLIAKLPSCNYTLLSWLMRHLSRVAANSDHNKMTLSNLGVVFSPCLDMPPILFKSFMTEVDYFFSERPKSTMSATAAKTAIASPGSSSSSGRPSHDEGDINDWDELEQSLVSKEPSIAVNSAPDRMPPPKARPAKPPRPPSAAVRLSTSDLGIELPQSRNSSTPASINGGSRSSIMSSSNRSSRKVSSKLIDVDDDIRDSRGHAQMDNSDKSLQASLAELDDLMF